MNTKNGIIIVNYNRADLLEACVNSLFCADMENTTIYVVDNGSSDGSVELMRQKYPTVRLISMGYNAGFCKGNNVGIQCAIDDGCDVIIFLNNDTEVDPQFVTELVRPLDIKKGIGMVAPKILLYATRKIFDSAGMIITKDGLAINRLLDQPSENGNEACEVFCPTGAAAAFHVDVLKDIVYNKMYFDEDYAYYLEDLDMGWRARLCGWSCMYSPQAIVYHHKNATSGGYSKFIAFHTNRNLFYNIIKNYPGVYCIRALMYSFFRYPYLLFLATRKKGIVSRFSNNVSAKDLMIVTLKGFWDVVTHSPSLWKKRRYIQKKRVAHDHGEWFEKFGIGFLESKK